WRAENLPETKRVFATEGLSTADYTKLVNSDKLVLVDFYADWCAPCKKMKPYLEKIAVEMSDKIILVRIDVDENPELCKELSVKSLPVLKLYKAEKIVWEHNGFVDEETVRTQLS